MALTPPTWRPSHVLVWTPRVGDVRSWLVKIIAMATAGRPATVAQTADDNRLGRPPAWVRFDDADDWLWEGLRGYRGEAGTVRVDRLED